MRTKATEIITGDSPTGKLETHWHKLPRLFLRRANGRAFSCHCGSLFKVGWACAGGDCVKVWEHVGEGGV